MDRGILHKRNKEIPYSGTFAPNAVLKGICDCDLIFVMLEFNKKLYLDETGEADEEKKRRISGMIDCNVADCVDLGYLSCSKEKCQNFQGVKISP